MPLTQGKSGDSAAKPQRSGIFAAQLRADPGVELFQRHHAAGLHIGDSVTDRRTVRLPLDRWSRRA
ncbi:MAG TPA: hypothetical protein VNH11_29120 [Pirellulales bacterium]|nr:hypothetical protein [Pirellulales bacterium]